MVDASPEGCAQDLFCDCRREAAGALAARVTRFESQAEACEALAVLLKDWHLPSEVERRARMTLRQADADGRSRAAFVLRRGRVQRLVGSSSECGPPREARRQPGPASVVIDEGDVPY